MDVQKFGRFIAEKRKEKKMTQVQMGEKLGVTGKTISRWENGNYMPDIALLVPIAELLEVTVDELLSGESKSITQSESSSVVPAIEYTKKRRLLHAKKYFSTIMLFFCFMIGVFLLLHIIFFAELPSSSGDTEKWKGLFASHSAYELELTQGNKPVFAYPDKAFEKAKSDYSDALQLLQKEFHLLPFSHYTVNTYQKHCEQVFSEDEIISSQLIGLSNFLEIYRNSYGWRNVFLWNTEEYEIEGEEDLSMTEEMQNAIAFFFGALVLGMFCIGFSFYFLWKNRKLNHLQGITEGCVIGIVKSGLFRNQTYGEVPGGVLMGWGVARGEQYWGGTLKMDIPPWFPCIVFEVGEKEYHVITGCGTIKDEWKIGQKVNVLYDPKNPRVTYVEGDSSYLIHQKIYLLLGILLWFICGIAYGLLFI